MRHFLTPRAIETYIQAPPKIKKAFDKQIALLVNNLRHPSLHAKKYDQTRDLWQGRITGSWRFFFTIKNDTYTIQEIIRHPK